MIAPACGSVVRDIVRKHLEIPGSKACLVTEDTPALKAAGFEDMVNCVFADGRDVLDKLAYLFDHPDTLEAITSRGHDLVHARHTIRARDQIFQWYTLNRSRRPSERIVQPTPFGPLTLVDGFSPLQNVFLRSGAVHLQRLAEGREALAASQLETARERFQEVLSYLFEFPEAKVGLATTSLALGNARLALTWIVEPLRCSLLRYGAEAPDPVEWAWLIVCLLCIGKLKAAKRRAEEFADLDHEELDLVRRAVTLLTEPQMSANPDAPPPGPSLSIHPTASRTLPEFLRSLAQLLVACNQVGLARQCQDHAEALRADSMVPESEPAHTTSTGDRARLVRRCEVAKQASRRRRPTLRGFDDPLLAWRLAGRARREWAALKARLAVLLRGAGAEAHRSDAGERDYGNDEGIDAHDRCREQRCWCLRTTSSTTADRSLKLPARHRSQRSRPKRDAPRPPWPRHGFLLRRRLPVSQRFPLYLKANPATSFREDVRMPHNHQSKQIKIMISSLAMHFEAMRYIYAGSAQRLRHT